MSEITGTAKVHEAYAFACMRCGHGWEQSYEIAHHMDASGQEFVVYVADGERVPSPLSSPTCLNCGGHVVRIMRAGQVSSVLDLMAHPTPKPAAKTAAAAAVKEGEQPASAEQPPPARSHHWHLSDLLHPFHHR
ncbi:hypothetical protein OG883_28210 [Streptomyces sp. NBC_01142]|uniref:hypothetical protein n=1 Tax=Streptomyces sp. NBC_01142 TaxID=2975865 RepID=UPI00225A5D66|nr:hypothetical protein [Streptomyces sp. NBC_01142]MCX4823690.1 hypothetical protein [Streptomyces sp. NBC_01142]